MHGRDIEQLIAIYRDGLLQDTLPFWMKHGVDREYGGFLTCLDRDGSLIDTDKGIWQQGRGAWLFATMYHRVERRPEWLEAARRAIEFLRRHGFDDDGRMFFQVTRDGRPLRKRRYVFSEAFAAIAMAAYARAGGDQQAARQARDLLQTVVRFATTPGLAEPKVDARTRPCKSLALPMILIATAQELRAAIDDPHCDRIIQEAIEEIRRDFMKPDLQAVLETVGPDGELIDHCDGRTLNPGHAIEAAWFILREADHQGRDPELIRTGTQILDWMWLRGWDQQHGGLFYFRDIKGLPVTEYWHDMKFWWPHNEAVLATLWAWYLTGDEKYAHRHRLVHQWAYGHFPDPQYGEWFGYLHRDGRLSVPLKGNLWKGPFHLPRMQWVAWTLLERMK